MYNGIYLKSGDSVLRKLSGVAGYSCLTSIPLADDIEIPVWNQYENCFKFVYIVFACNILSFLVFCILHHFKAGRSLKGYNRQQEIKESLYEIRQKEKIQNQSREKVERVSRYSSSNKSRDKFGV
jgi:hypothetical protein